MKIYPHLEGGEIIELVRKDEHDAVVTELREKLNWQNQRNSGTPTRGGYEFYINEEWQSGGVPTLMRERFDTDDERVRVRRVIEDDAMLDTIVQLRAELTRWQSLAESLATTAKLSYQTDLLREALATYESAKHGNFPDLLAEAVKRMESVRFGELESAYWQSGNGLENVRARLISAAKGEQP